MRDEIAANAAWGAMGVNIPSQGTVRRVWSDSLSAVGPPVLWPAGGGFVGWGGLISEIQSDLRAGEGHRYP